MKLTNSLSKTSFLLIIIYFATSSSFAQNIRYYSKAEAEYYKINWFGDISMGTRLFGANSSEAELNPGFNINAGLGYFFTERIGIKGRMDFNTYKLTPGIGDDAEAIGYTYSLSLEVITDLMSLIYGTTFKPKDWRIILHSGLGYTTYSGKDFKENYEVQFEDAYLKGNDDMGHIILGITPQYHLSTNWSVNLDLSTFLLIGQDFTFDNYNNERLDGLGNISALSLGLTFRP